MTKELGKGLMHVVEKRTGERMATLAWSGSLWDGTGDWIFFRDDEAKDRISLAISEGKKRLGPMLVDDMCADAQVVPIWKGFSGMYGGLRLALPKYGMDLDYDEIAWPDYETVGDSEAGSE